MDRQMGWRPGRRALLAATGAALAGCAPGWNRIRPGSMGDVGVGVGDEVWLAGRDGTVWRRSGSSNSFEQIPGPGAAIARVSPGRGKLWAVGFDGSLWFYDWTLLRPGWQRTSASGIGDVSASEEGPVWVAGRDNGTLWLTGDTGSQFTQMAGNRLFRLAASRNYIVWGVFIDRTVWRFQGVSWTPTQIGNMRDVAWGGPDQRIWLAGQDGNVWWSQAGGAPTRIEATGIQSLDVAWDGKVWGVDENGYVWRSA